MEVDEDDHSGDPATPELFACAYNSDGRTTPDDASSIDGFSAAGCSQPKKKKRGRPSMYLTGEPVDLWRDMDNDVEYKIGDFIFFEGRKSSGDFRIGMILAIRKTKKHRFMVSVRLYFKASHLPEGVYQRLMEDRNGENLGGFGDFLSNNPVIKEREVFKSEKSEVIRSHSIRGRCSVIQLTDVKSAKRFVPVADTFFTLLGYNPDTRRLATIQGEIRIGSSHQAKLPECKPNVQPSARACRAMPEGIGGGDNGEEQLWSPGRIHSDELEEYITATISMVASYTNMSERKPVDESVSAARRDENKQLALNHLHRNDYDKNRAIAEFVTSVPLVRSVDRRWEEEDSKKFMKGLRVYGKNFFKIRREFLPEKETKELIEYYYYWKKTPISTIPNRTGRRPKSRKTGGSTSKAPSSTGENSSESEEADCESYTCFRCDTENSNQWHYVDQHGFVCESCKLNYRKYGDENGERIPEYLFRPVEPASSYQRPMPKRTPKQEAEGSEVLPGDRATEEDRKSPGASSTSSNTSTGRTPRKRKSKSPGKMKRSIMAGSNSVDKTDEVTTNGGVESENENIPSEVAEKKPKIEHSSPDSLASELRRDEQGRDADGEDAGNMGDVEQDDNSTSSPRSNADSVNSDEVEEPVLPDNVDAVPCYELFHEREHAHFARCLKRVDNSCCRVDVHYVPPPGSEMFRRREERMKKPPTQSTVAQPATIPHMSHSQNNDVKVKSEPAMAIGSDVIRHTSQPQQPIHGMKIPPSSMQSPQHLGRDQQRMTPTQAQVAAMSSHHPSHPAHGPAGHRVTTPSQRVTPRSQHSGAEQFVGPGTPALLQLSQLAAGRQQLGQQPSMAEEMARLAAYSAPTSAAAAMGLTAGMDPAAQQMQSLHYYRMMRTIAPEQAERMYPQEVRERLDMALKAQDIESQHKLLMAQAGQPSLDNKGVAEAHLMEMQRKFGIPPGAMMPPGAVPGFPMGLLPPNSLPTGNSAAEIIARDREKMAKLGLFGGASPMADPMVAMAQAAAAASPAERMSAERLAGEQRLAGLSGSTGAAAAHAHTHTHTHLHLHQAEQAAQAAAAQAAAAAAMASQNHVMAQQIMNSLGVSPEQAALVARAAASGIPYSPFPPGFPGTPPFGIPTSAAGEVPAQLMAAFAAAQQGAAGGQEMNQRDILAMQQMLANPALAQAAQHEAHHLQLLQQRERERQIAHHLQPQ